MNQRGAVILARVCLTLLFMTAGWKVFHQLAASYAFSTLPGIDGAARAIAWDASGAEYYFQLGLAHRDEIEHLDLQAASRDLAGAVRLNPYNWRYWVESARCSEISGSLDQAEKAYLHAMELNPQAADFRWRLANFYVRRRELEKSFPHFAAAVSLQPSYQDACLELLWKLGVGGRVLCRIWPEDKASRLELVSFLAAKQAKSEADHDDLIKEQWSRLLGSDRLLAAEEDMYVRYLLQHRDYRDARQQWIRLLARNGSRDPNFEAGRNLIWDGGFEESGLGGSFDWSPTSEEGYSVARAAREGVEESPGLRLDFFGTVNLDSALLRQKVIVDPGQRYTLSFYARSRDITTEQGIFFEVTDEESGAALQETPRVLGTTPWTRYSASFQTGGTTHTVLVTLRRRRSRRIDNLLGGTFWLDLVTLEAASKTLRQNSHETMS